ncbi:MAG: DDE-type integrase/transposase/recombinase [archaeon]
MSCEQNNPKDSKVLDLKKLSKDRDERAKLILDNGNPKVLDEATYLVPSSNHKDNYKVSHIDSWTCECKDFQLKCKDNGLFCKHIKAIQFFLKFKNKVELDDMNVDNEINDEICIYCKSKNIVKDGIRKNKGIQKQKFLCRDCKKRFVLEPIKYIKANGKIITLVMNDYFKGHSLRDIKDSLFQFYNMNVTHETIRRWIRRFCKIMNNYTNKLDIKLGDSWHVDEQVVKVNKNKNEKWVWNLIDAKTRFLIANNVTKERSINEARIVFKKAKQVTDKQPLTITSDGLLSYVKAIKKEYVSHKISWNRIKGVEHISNAGISKTQNNNPIERYHNEFREFEKIRRNFKSMDTLEEWNDNYRLYHNFIKQNMAINYKTPSNIATGLILDKNRWLSLLKLSLNQPNMTKEEEVKKSVKD